MKYMIISFLLISQVFGQSEQLGRDDDGLYSNYQEELLEFWDYFGNRSTSETLTGMDLSTVYTIFSRLDNILSLIEIHYWGFNLNRHISDECLDEREKGEVSLYRDFLFRTIKKDVEKNIRETITKIDVEINEFDYNTSTWMKNCKKLLIKIRRDL